MQVRKTNLSFLSIPELNPVGPPRPSAVEGCYVRFEKIEVTHAVIQLVLAVLGNNNIYLIIDQQ